MRWSLPRDLTWSRFEEWLDSSLQVAVPRSTVRIMVLLSCLLCLGSIGLSLRQGGGRADVLPTVVVDVAAIACELPLLFLPMRWVSRVYVALAAATPVLAFTQVVTASTPAGAVAATLTFQALPIVAFTLWGARSGLVLALLTGEGLVAIALTGAVGALPAPYVFLAFMLLLGDALLLGWAAHRTGRLDLDPLTGLPNRRGLDQQLEGRLRRTATRSEPLVLVIVDVDGLRRLDAAIGHSRADVVLRRAARSLAGTLEDGDTVYHLGAGTFAALLSDRGGHGAAVAEELRTCLPPEVTASAGVAVSAPDDTPRLLVTRAETSLTRAKAEGGGRLDPRAHDHAMLHDIAAGLDGGQFTVVYQPIVDLATGATVGAEALARWRHPVRGQVFPDAFVPLAEDSGLIHELGRQIMAMACAETAGAVRAGLRLDRLSVNASALELGREDYARTVLEILDRTGFDPARLTIEVTESSVAGGDQAVVQSLDRLRAAGVRIAIDDFGTGYSCLSRLGQLPVDTLKIDKCFVWATPDEGRDSLLLAITGLAATFGLATVAEGVETWDHVEMLRGMGCDYAQGYLFGRPGPFADLGAGRAATSVPAPSMATATAPRAATVPRPPVGSAPASAVGVGVCPPSGGGPSGDFPDEGLRAWRAG